MPGAGPRAKYWCFTLNNYTDQDVIRLSAETNRTSALEDVNYIIFGKEVGASGTPHLQGTVCFQSRKRMSQVKSVIGQAHFTLTRNLSQSIEYCKKDGDFTELGVLPEKENGKRSDIEDFKNAVKEDPMITLADIRENYSEVYARYPRFCVSYLEQKKPTIGIDTHVLREWQGNLFNRLLQAPDKREIIFIVDRVGNTGKSWFARYYCHLQENGQIVIPGKKADMAYVIDPTRKVFFFDCPRSKQGDFIQYDFLEELKNGYIFSPKYESKIKILKTPHIVVCMNETPDMSKLSEDRYMIINL
jgi:hypothetical protein